MVWFVIGIILLIVGIVACPVLSWILWDGDGKKKKMIWPAFAGIGLCVVLTFVGSMAEVPAGYTGILTTFGKIENRSVSAGLNWVYPWQKIVTMDNRVQKIDLNMSVFSKDIQQVDVNSSVSFCIDQSTAVNLYRTVGVNYYDSVIYPSITDNMEGVFSMFDAESLISNRDSLSDLVTAAVQNDVESYGIQIVRISVQNIDFSDAFTNAVEAKQVAVQDKLKAETEQAQLTMEKEAEAERAIIAANAEAQQAVIAAQADLEVVQIQAEASLYAGQREAEMNQRIAEALTADLINYYWIKQWDGKLPSTVLDPNGNYMIDLSR